MTAISNLVQQQALSLGVGDFSLSAVNGRQSFFQAFGTGGNDAFFYCIANEGSVEWEVGTGHLLDATTLVRDTVISSSNSGSLVDFSAGIKNVVNDIPAEYRATLTMLNAEMYPALTFEGRDITVGAFSIMSAAGVSISIAGGTVTIPANSTQYIVADLASKGIKALDRSYHDGSVVLAKVVTNGSVVTNLDRLWAGEAPKTFLHRFLTRLNGSLTSDQIRIAVIGDSLMSASGTGTAWDELLFNAANSADGYNINNVDNVTVDNYAIGGSTTAYGITLVGEGVYSNSGSYNDTSFVWGHAEGARRFSPPLEGTGISPLLADPYDLVIIGYGANGGSYHTVLMENIIAALRRAGSEVVIVTQNYRSDNAAFLKTAGDNLKKMALNYGCALVDTWMYVLEKERAGNTVLADAVHMAAAGHEAYAEALLGVLSPVFELPAGASPKNPARCVAAAYSNVNEWIKYPNSCQVQFTPYSTTGTLSQSTTVTAPLGNPALLFGDKTTANAVTVLDVGEYANFGHPYAANVDLLFDGGSAFTAEIYQQSGSSLMGTVTYNPSTLLPGRPIVGEGLAGAGSFANVTTNFRSNKGVRVVCTSGSLKLLGVVFHCDRSTELDIEKDVVYNGSFATEGWYYGHPISIYSDTDGDSFTFTFEGSEAVVYLSRRAESGMFDVYRNGKKIISQQDMYAGGNYIGMLRIPAGASLTDYKNKRKAKTTIQVVLNGANGSVGTPVAQRRLMGLLGITVFDRG